MFRSLTAIAAMALTACSMSPEAAEPRFPSPEAAAEYHVMVGELAARRQQPAVAARHFMQALAQVEDANLAMRAASLALSADDEQLAYDAARRWQALDDGNLDAREAVARLALRNGDPGEALRQCRAIVESHPAGPSDGFRQVALLLSHEGDRQTEAMALMDQLVEQRPGLHGAHYGRSLLSLRFGELERAEASARQAVKLSPDSRDALLLLTGVLIKRDDLEGADQVFAQLLEDSERPGELRMGYARLLLDAEHDDGARRQFEHIVDAEPGHEEARYALGLLALEREDLDGAEPQFRALLSSEELGQQAVYYLGRIEDLRRNFDAALDWYGRVVEGDLAIDAVIHRAFVLGELDRLDEARALLNGMRNRYPSLSTRFFLAEGEVLLESDRREAALAVYDSALERAPEDVDLLYGRSLAYERLADIDAAEADLRTILEQNSEDARALNALGYMLTVHTDRLDEAREMISRALELTPDDAAVIDSMGWVEFRLGKVEAARSLLEKAFGKLRDPEIAAHLGEVLWTLGQRDDARAVWDAALERNPDHRVLRETIDRLVP